MGLEARERAAAVEPHEVAACRGPPGPGRPAGGAGLHPGAGSGAGPPRPDDGLAVHLLPGRGQDHGGGPEGTPVAGLEVQLCGDAHLSNFGVFASPGAEPAVRLNDFDETLPGPFEYDVKRMAASFTIAARNNGFSKADTRAATLASVTGLPGGDGRVRADAERWTSGTPTWTRTSSWRGSAARWPSGDAGERPEAGEGRQAGKGAKKVKRAANRRRRTGRGEGGEEGGEAGGEDRREGAHPRQPAGAVQARRAGGWQVPDRQPAADRGPGARPGRHLRACPPTRSARCSANSSGPTGRPCRMIGGTCWSGSRSWTWPARSSVSAASAPGRSSCCSRDATRRTRCSCRSRRRPPRCWRITCRRAGTSSTASGWCRGSG